MSGFFYAQKGIFKLATSLEVASVGALAPYSVEVRMPDLLIEVLKEGTGVGVAVAVLVFAPAVYLMLFGRSERPARRFRSILKAIRSPKRR